MAKPLTSLIESFYRNFYWKDVRSLLPDLDSITMEAELDQSYEKFLSALVLDPEHWIRVICALGKSLEVSLTTLKPLVIPVTFEQFFPRAWIGEHLCLPLAPLWETLFQLDGEVLPHIKSEAYQASLNLANHQEYAFADEAMSVLVLRQFCLAFSKDTDLECATDPDDEINAFEKRITGIPQLHLDDNMPIVRRIASLLLRTFFLERSGSEVLLGADLAQWESNPFGRHGPGAVSEGEKGVHKWDFENYPSVDNVLFSTSRGNLFISDEEAEPSRLCSRLAIVPKDFRGHRLICIEPKEHMFAQQGLMQVLYSRIERHPLTRLSIRLKSQERARKMSKNFNYSTIDLKDASDLVSRDLCKVLLPKEVFRVLSRYRTRRIDVGGKVLPSYTTMFTMGNALCFPIETLVFWALSVAAIYCSEKRYTAQNLIGTSNSASPTFLWDRRTLSGYEDTEVWGDLSRICRDVSVFGDDIIVPSSYYYIVTSCLEYAGLKVNYQKSCNETLVRESCGTWWFARRDCTITRFQHHKLTDTRVWCSWAEDVRELMTRGFNASAMAVCELMAQKHPVPYGSVGFPGIRVVSEGYRWNEDLQRLEVRIPAFSDEAVNARLRGDVGLYSYFVGAGSLSTVLAQRPKKGVKWIWSDVNGFVTR